MLLPKLQSLHPLGQGIREKCLFPHSEENKMKNAMFFQNLFMHKVDLYVCPAAFNQSTKNSTPSCNPD